MNMKTLKLLVATFVVLLATYLNGQASSKGSLYKIDTPGTYHVKAELDISDGSTAKSPQIDLMVK